MMSLLIHLLFAVSERTLSSSVHGLYIDCGAGKMRALAIASNLALFIVYITRGKCNYIYWTSDSEMNPRPELASESSSLHS